MTTDELIAYYAELLIMQYATLPNAVGMVSLFISQVIADQIVQAVQDGFNFAVQPIGIQLDSALGVQLDAVASYQGASRVIYGLAPNQYFQFPDASQAGSKAFNGFMDAASPSVPWLFLTAENTQQPIYSLTDDQLYRLTQLRSQVNSSSMGLGAIDTILEEFFGDNVALLDNENMTMIYIDLNSDTDPLFTIAAISHSLPQPAGVGTLYIKADLLNHFFGLQDAATGYNPAFAGFSDPTTSMQVGTFISAP